MLTILDTEPATGRAGPFNVNTAEIRFFHVKRVMTGMALIGHIDFRHSELISTCRRHKSDFEDRFYMIVECTNPSENELYCSEGFQFFDELFFIVGGKFQISNIREHLFTSFIPRYRETVSA